MKGGRVIRPFIVHRVTKWQSDTTSTPYTGGWNFLCRFLINSPTCFARRGIKWHWKKKLLKTLHLDFFAMAIIACFFSFPKWIKCGKHCQCDPFCFTLVGKAMKWLKTFWKYLTLLAQLYNGMFNRFNLRYIVFLQLALGRNGTTVSLPNLSGLPVQQINRDNKIFIYGRL